LNQRDFTARKKGMLTKNNIFVQLKPTRKVLGND
jgi:hypothetical protein